MSADIPAFLLSRLCQPRRIGLLGRRGVGKTTLLTMLYREASQGRIPGLRLAAADERTAEYLRDKITALEQGQPLPATLAQTALQLTLDQDNRRLELLVLDYQGEQVQLGQTEPIRSFFQSCDVVLLCLDALESGPSHCPEEMELEQIIEQYLRQPPEGEEHRPMALLRMRADRAAWACDDRFAPQTRHTLALHEPRPEALAPGNIFSVSCLRPAGWDDHCFTLQPEGLAEVLYWLADSLHRVDAARLAHLFRLPASVPHKRQALHAFARAYPNDPLVAELAPEVRMDWSWWRRVGIGLAAALLLLLGIGLYDRWGAAHMLALDERLREDPLAAHQAWQRYERWHPTRHWFGAADPRRARLAAFAAALAELETRLDSEPLETLLAEWQQLQRSFATLDPPERFAAVQQRLLERRQQHAAQLWADLLRREASGDWEQLLAHADQLAHHFTGLPFQAELERKVADYRDRLEERAYQQAVDYSARWPEHFLTRRQHYQSYLQRYPEGRFASAARAAVARIHDEWDRSDYRNVRDQFVRDPAAFDQLRSLGRAYLASHPRGRFGDAVQGLLRWCDQVSEPGEYTVRLVSGVFDRKAAFWASRGVSAAVSLEIGGIRYGPSPIIQNNYAPQWDFTFPRKVRWKSGDRVRVIITDHYFWKRTLVDRTFEDPLALQHLCDLLDFKKCSLRFESDFTMPSLPRAD